MFKALWSIGNDGFDKIEALRRDVNVKGRGIAEDEEFDAVDSFAGHVYVCLQTEGSPLHYPFVHSVGACKASSLNVSSSCFTLSDRPTCAKRLALPLYMAITASYFGNTSTYCPNAPLNWKATSSSLIHI